MTALTARITLALLLIGACSEGTGPGGGLRVIASPVTDTVEAEPVQALVMELRETDGRPASGVIVRFRGLPAAPPFVTAMEVGGPARAAFGSLAIDTTDAQGRAVTRVRFGTVAGAGGIEVNIPLTGVVDTVAFTVLPGNATALRVLPRDTAVYVGNAVQLRSHVVDRFDNPRPDPVTYTLFSTPVAAGSVTSGGRVSAATTGRIGVIVTAALSSRDTVFVSAVPRGILAAVDRFSGVLVTTGVDGSGYQVLRPLTGGAFDFEPAWSPDGTEVAVTPSGVFQQIHRVRLDGSTVPLDLPNETGGSNALWPAYSPDGQFIYVTNSVAGSIWRIRIDGSSAEGMTPNGAVAYRPAVSRDGRYLAFYAVSQSGFSLVTRVLDVQTRSYVGTDVTGSFPEWSPVSDSLGFLESGLLRLMHFTGSGRRDITTPGEGELVSQQLAWSPDGKWIVAGTPIGFDVIEVSTGLRLPLAFAVNLRHPAWKPGS